MYGLNGAPAIWQRYVDGLFQASDASPVGINCVMSHVYQMALNVRSRSHQELLSGSEKNTPKLIRKLFFNSLGTIFGSRGLPVLAATRLLHYALILQSFEFDIIFRKTIEHGNADFLSRLPKTSEELEVKDDITIFQMSQIEALPVTSKELRRETSKDIVLGPLLRALREGKDLQGRKPSIPLRMITILKKAAKLCRFIARYKADPPESKVHYWEYPSMPWERIHVDFAGPILNTRFFLIVDAHSNG
ncbi:uncharacterized protein K02A2.6 [Trichonephila clavipes]|nr:uncharacterized protein K02A2.6 [Trichonephila clavipes]